MMPAVDRPFGAHASGALSLFALPTADIEFSEALKAGQRISKCPYPSARNIRATFRNVLRIAQPGSNELLK